MTSRLTKLFSLVLLSSVVLLGAPALAADPDVDSPAGPQLPTARTDRPDFQQDEGPGQLLDPQAEGADPAPHLVDPVPPIEVEP